VRILKGEYQAPGQVTVYNGLMNERFSSPLPTPNHSEVSNVRLRIAEASQIACVLATEFRGTLTKGAIFAASVLGRMHGNPTLIEWDPDLEDWEEELAQHEQEEHEKLRAIYREMSRRRCIRQK
jgi:hypothetical protein